MSNSVQVIDELLTKFHKEIRLPSNESKHSKECHNHKHQNGIIKDTSSLMESKEEETKEFDELSEEEALRLAMEMSMNEEDRKLVRNINKEITEAQSHLSDWFAGNHQSIKDKNKAWFNFCRRLHHNFEMYRIEQGIIQPLNYQFFIQFLVLMYGRMADTKGHNKNSKKKKKRNRNDTNDETLYIDQHKIRNIQILSADDDAIKYLQFTHGVSKSELASAIYAKFESLALDPLNPNQWKFNHVMFIPSGKAPNGLLWTKWHMQ